LKTAKSAESGELSLGLPNCEQSQAVKPGEPYHLMRESVKRFVVRPLTGERVA
jgi:hypothetical protein